MKKKVLVTGAAGFIGRYVVNELLKREYDVAIILYDKESIDCHKRDDSIVNGDINVISGDICEENIIQSVVDSIEKCDIFIHLAADININGNDRTILVNCLGTYHCVKLANALGAECFIYMSSIPVIGTPCVLPVTEEHPALPKTLYHITKYSGEMIVEREKSKDMKTIILRIPSPIGFGMSPNNYLSFLLGKCMRNELIEVYGTGARIQNYIDVRDIASAVVQSFTTKYSGIFLIAGSKSVSNLELALLCKEITGSESEIIYGQREDPEEKNQWIISTDKAKQAFGFFPRYGLRETIQWILSNMENK